MSQKPRKIVARPPETTDHVRDLALFAVGVGVIANALVVYSASFADRPFSQNILAQIALLVGLLPVISGLILLRWRTGPWVRTTMAVSVAMFVVDAVYSANVAAIMCSALIAVFVIYTGLEALVQVGARPSRDERMQNREARRRARQTKTPHEAANNHHQRVVDPVPEECPWCEQTVTCDPDGFCPECRRPI